MSIKEYGANAIETGSGEVRSATTTVFKMACLGQLQFHLTPDQQMNESILVALAMLLDNGVHIQHTDCTLTTMFFRS